MKLLRRRFLRLAAVAAAFSTSALRLALAVEFRIRPVRIVVPNEGHLGYIQKLDSSSVTAQPAADLIEELGFN